MNVFNTVMLVHVLIIFTSLLSHKETAILLVSRLPLLKRGLMRLYSSLLSTSLSRHKLLLEPGRHGQLIQECFPLLAQYKCLLDLLDLSILADNLGLDQLNVSDPCILLLPRGLDLLLHVLGRVAEVLLVLGELVGVLGEGLLGLLELLLLHYDVLFESLGLLVLVVDRDLTCQDLPRVQHEVLH